MNPFPSKLVCIGRNYAAHAEELANEIPDEPVVFLKPPSSLVEHGGRIIIPLQSNDVHHEVELVVRIGADCKSVKETDAMSYAEAYAVGLDMTARDIQSRAKQKGLPWSIAKGFDTFAPVGRFMPSDTVDPSDLELTLKVNGQTRQKGHTGLMLFPVPVLISYCSSVFTLRKGDLLFTGTPAGVGPVKAGDHLIGRITGLPALEVDVVENESS